MDVTVWTYPPEILPPKIRAKGAALAAAADFAGNFLVVEVTPVGVSSLGFGFYFIWAALNVCNAVIVWLFYPEIASLRLEAVDLIFTESVPADDAFGEKQPFYRKLQWKAVARAAEVKRNKQSLRHKDGSSSPSSLEDVGVDVRKSASEERIEHTS